MRRPFAILTLALLFSSAAGVVAQSESYAERFSRLSQSYAKRPTSVEALYDLAQFYFDNSHPMRNLPMAMDYARRAEAEHIYLLENNKIKELTKLVHKGIDLNSLRSLKQTIVMAARNTAKHRRDFSAAEWDAYMQTFADDAEIIRLLKQNRLQQLYSEALEEATPDAYYRFLVLYPGTTEAAKMEELLDQSAPQLFEEVESDADADAVVSRYPQSPAVKRRAAENKSQRAYRHTMEEGTIAACRHYLGQYPTSSESQAVREHLDSLVELDFQRRHTAIELAHFADSNADLPLADEALASLRTLIVERHDVEAAQYFVDHFKMDPQYNTLYSRYYGWHAVEGNSAPLLRFAERNPEFPYQRLLDDDLERAAEIDTIPLHQPYSETLYPRYASYVRHLMGKAIAIVPLQRMLQPLLDSRNYDGAEERMSQFEICFENQWQEQYNELLRLVTTPTPGRALRHELSDSASLLHPVLHPDGRLYCTRVAADGSRAVVRAVRRGERWQLADTVPFTTPVPSDLTLFSFADGGRRMLLGSAGEILFAERDGDAWRLSEMPPYPVNTDYVETDAFMLPDGSGLLLASDRPGGHNMQPSGALFHGDTALATDLWFIPFRQDRWGQPVNLGIGLNTPYCERSPVLSRNLKTLYFISDGHTGLGYGDVMVAERTSTTDWTSWSTPVNAGREVNSALREHSLSLSPDEQRLYLSTDRGSHSAVESCAAWHDAAVSYTPRTLGVAGLEPYLFRLKVVDLDRQTVVSTAEYTGEGSSMMVNLGHGGRYVVLAEAGQLFVPAMPVEAGGDERLLLQGYSFAQLVSADRALPLPALLFADATASLLPVAQMQLSQLARFLERHPEGKVELCVDVAGGDTRGCYNLSLERGVALRRYLAAEGIASSRVILSPYGNVNVGRNGQSTVTVRFRE